jgi:hypothetical protein
VYVEGGGEGKGDENLLVGEVTEISLNSDRRRRIYLTLGAYLMADISEGEAKITGQGKSGCIILGNKLTQRLAGEMIRKAGGKMSEEIMKSIFIDVGSKTASVSSDYAVLCAKVPLSNSKVPLSNPKDVLLAVLQEDCMKSGWRLCGQQ